MTIRVIINKVPFTTRMQLLLDGKTSNEGKTLAGPDPRWNAYLYGLIVQYETAIKRERTLKKLTNRKVIVVFTPALRAINPGVLYQAAPTGQVFRMFFTINRILKEELPLNLDTIAAIFDSVERDAVNKCEISNKAAALACFNRLTTQTKRLLTFLGHITIMFWNTASAEFTRTTEYSWKNRELVIRIIAGIVTAEREAIGSIVRGKLPSHLRAAPKTAAPKLVQPKSLIFTNPAIATEFTSDYFNEALRLGGDPYLTVKVAPPLGKRHFGTFSKSKSPAAGKKKKLYTFHRNRTGERSKSPDVLLRPRDDLRESDLPALTPHDFVNDAERNYYDTKFNRDFIDNKKRVNHVIAKNVRKNIEVDRCPNKYFYYRHRRDPIYNSALLEKIVNSFMKDGKKEKIRNIFYNLFSTYKEDGINLHSLYDIIESLRPRYLNVLVRKGMDIYRVPIKASDLKSTQKAIRFFKLAVLSRRYEERLEDKILDEMIDSLYTFGYYNQFHKEHVETSAANLHLRHYRTKKVY